MKAFLRTTMAVAAMTLLFSSCGGGGGETPVVPEDYDWVLYRTSGLAGTEADCPRP